MNKLFKRIIAGMTAIVVVANLALSATAETEYWNARKVQATGAPSSASVIPEVVLPFSYNEYFGKVTSMTDFSNTTDEYVEISCVNYNIHQNSDYPDDNYVYIVNGIATLRFFPEDAHPSSPRRKDWHLYISANQAVPANIIFKCTPYFPGSGTMYANGNIACD